MVDFIMQRIWLTTKIEIKPYGDYLISDNSYILHGIDKIRKVSPNRNNGCWTDDFSHLHQQPLIQPEPEWPIHMLLWLMRFGMKKKINKTDYLYALNHPN